MSREWKPGDVALLQAGTSCGRIGLRTATNDAWRTAAGLMSDASCPEGAVHRLLVVLDPEDREQVERLESIYRAAIDSDRPGSLTDVMQAALREFANPTPPEEPTDPTARIIDRRENVWRLLADGDWVCTSGPDVGEYLVWRQLATERAPLAVEVTP